MERNKGNPDWQKGITSPNPKGRPKGSIAQLIDAVCGEGARTQLEVIEAASRGIMINPHEPGAFLKVPAKVRFEAALWIVERRHGKATNTLQVEDVTPREDPTVDLGRLEQGELGDLERLLQKGHAGEIVEGEIVEARPRGNPYGPHPLDVLSGGTP